MEDAILTGAKIIGVLIALGGVGAILKHHGDAIQRLHRGLYRDDGTLVYVTQQCYEADRRKWEEQHAQWRAEICKKLERITHMIRAADDKRDSARDMYVREWADLQRTMATLAVRLEEHEKKG